MSGGGGNTMARRQSNSEDMSAEDRRRFDLWLGSNAAVGFVLFAALVAMALAPSDARRQLRATAENADGLSSAPASGAISAFPR
jgi:hypothetical protein